MSFTITTPFQDYTDGGSSSVIEITELEDLPLPPDTTAPEPLLSDHLPLHSHPPVLQDIPLTRNILDLPGGLY